MLGQLLLNLTSYLISKLFSYVAKHDLSLVIVCADIVFDIRADIGVEHIIIVYYESKLLGSLLYLTGKAIAIGVGVRLHGGQYNNNVLLTSFY